MDISVVIPVYNRAKIISKALESLCNQTYKNFEVIIVDDGSNDFLNTVIDEYNGKIAIKMLCVPHCANIAYLRNVGLKAAQGKYIANLDSDDWCTSERLEKQIAYLDNNPDVDIVATWVELDDECLTENTRRLDWLYNVNRTENEMMDVFLNDGCCICNSSVMMRKDKIEYIGGYDEQMVICEDFNLWIKAIMSGCTIRVMKEKLTIRKLHKQSITEGYCGSLTAVRLVLRNKLEVLRTQGKLKRQIVIWGINQRNEILISELERIDKTIEYSFVDIYNDYPKIVDKEAFHLVTTYSKKDEVFIFLDEAGLQRTVDYIYA